MVQRNGKPAIAQDFGVRRSPSAAPVWRFLAVDPGDVHVGLAEFTRFEVNGPWICTWAAEMDPVHFLPWFVERLRQDRWEHVVVEEWRLFPQAAPMYVGSDMPTSRLIGAIHALAAFIPDDGAWFDDPVHVWLQSPQIKTPTRGWLRKRKMQSVAGILRVTADHARDAELHGYKWLIDHGGTIGNATVQAEYWKSTGARLTPRQDLW